MRVAIISTYDPIPGDDAQLIRFAKLADHFSEQGYFVDYFTSGFFHLNKVQRNFSSWQDTKQKGINLHLIKTNSYKYNISPGRILNHFVFAIRLRKVFQKYLKIKKPDLVIVAYPPVLSAYLSVKICKKQKIPVIADVLDWWPDAFKIVLRFKPIYYIVSLPFTKLRNNTFSKSTALCSVSETYRTFLSKNKNFPLNSEVAYLGINTKLFLDTIDEKWDLYQKTPDEKWIVFIGASTHNPALQIIPEIASRMQGFRFFLLGKNNAFTKILFETEKSNIPNVHVLGAVSFYNLANIIYRSDVGLLFIDPVSGTSFPNKLFYYLIGGLKVVSNFKNTDLVNLSNALNCIFFINDNSQDSMIRSIENASKTNTTDKEFIQNFAIENYDWDKIYHSYYNWASEINNL